MISKALPGVFAVPLRDAPQAVFSVVYGDLIEELRHDLAADRSQPVPVFPFPYDWRQPLTQTEQLLGGFVEEVIARTKLLRHYASDRWMDDPRVDLVAHSMGGLVVTGYVQSAGAQASVGKVATLGTPYRGSFEAPIKVITGTASDIGGPSSSRERDMSTR